MPYLNFQRVRELASLVDVLRLLRIGHRRKGTQLRATCPLCERDDTWSGSTVKNKWQCRKCGAKGDVIDLFRKLTGKKNNYDAAVELCRSLNIPLPADGHR